ncbi:MAG: hypothetical protein IKT65_00375, partial [Clostridia bacterium]|nr:hypothetical protein [Clostridia bacterium]
MKFKIKRILAVMLVFCMMMGMVPMTAFAEESEPEKYNVWVAGTQVTSANAGNILGDGAASYDAATNTLTVSNDIVTTDIWGTIEAKTTEDFTVIIADGVTLSAENETCIDVENNLIINCVDLDVTSGSHGIFSKNGSVGFTGKEISVVSDGIGIYGNNIKIKCDKLAVDAKGTMAMLASSGICSENNIEIECNTLSVASGDEESIYAKNGDVTISGSEDSEIVLVAGDGNGVRSFGDTTIKGGKLGITARRGIYGYGSVNLTVEEISIGAEIYGIGATNVTTGSNNITIKSDKLSVVSADGDAIISDEGDVIITGSENCEITITADDYGICAEKGSIELTAKDVFVKSKNDYAIDCYEDITIDCDMAKIIGRVTGIRTNGSIIIQNGNFDIQSTDTSESELNYPALRFKTDFTYPAGATVVAATEVDGTFEPYDKNKNATYDHVKISQPAPITYTVTFDSDGGSAVTAQTIEEGQKATKPA